jgi:hypothetical protein
MGCCGQITFDGKRFECSNGATANLDDDGVLTVTLPGCKPFNLLTCDQQHLAVVAESAAWVAMRAVNAVSPEVACSILDVPGGYNAVAL